MNDYFLIPFVFIWHQLVNFIISFDSQVGKSSYQKFKKKYT